MAEASLLIPHQAALSENTKRPSLPLLLSNVYELNNSATKKACIGLQYNEVEEKYQPVIQLKNSCYSRGLVIDIKSWQELQEKTIDIDEYFKYGVTPTATQPARIQLSCIDIDFSTSYGMKSVVFANRKYVDSQPPKKRKRGYEPSIVIQKATFENLKSLFVCIDERYRRLDRIAHEATYCKKLLREEVQKIISVEDFKKPNSDIIVKNVMFDRREYLQDLVLNKFQSARYQTFVNIYFDMFFIELVILHSTVFHDEISDLLCGEKEPAVSE